MKDGFQGAQLDWVEEDLRGESLPVQVTCGVHDPWEAGCNLGQRRRAGQNQVAGDPIGIDETCPFALQKIRDRAFAGSDAAGETVEPHPLSLHGPLGLRRATRKVGLTAPRSLPYSPYRLPAVRRRACQIPKTSREP